MKFSANLGFLWSELALPDAIRAAARAGFDAVECHWPYDTSAAAVQAALEETGLPLLGLNTRRGGPGEFGLSALPGREDEARAAIGEALDYAIAAGAQSVHVMAGTASGTDAHRAFCRNLRHACKLARPHGIMVLIEPLNPHDAPGYFLHSASQAAAIISELGLPELRMMFDCYHQQITAGDVCRSFERFLPLIGHVQIASVPGRARPDTGELDYRFVLEEIGRLGWDRPIGAEYRPEGSSGTELDWLPRYQAIPVRRSQAQAPCP